MNNNKKIAIGVFTALALLCTCSCGLLLLFGQYKDGAECRYMGPLAKGDGKVCIKSGSATPAPTSAPQATTAPRASVAPTQSATSGQSVQLGSYTIDYSEVLETSNSEWSHSRPVESYIATQPVEACEVGGTPQRGSESCEYIEFTSDLTGLVVYAVDTDKFAVSGGGFVNTTTTTSTMTTLDGRSTLFTGYARTDNDELDYAYGCFESDLCFFVSGVSGDTAEDNLDEFANFIYSLSIE